MPNATNVCLIVGALLLVGLFIYWCMGKDKKKEPYMSAGAIDHLDSLDSRYELVQSPEDAVPAAQFADIVDTGDQAKFVQQAQTAKDIRPIERLDRLQTKDMLPSTAAHLPQYNIDVANPSAYAFATSAPRVVLKNRYNMQADPIRGDIPIRYHPDVPLISTSSIDRDAWRGDGYFSDTFAHLYNKLTGRAFKNMPLRQNTESTVLDFLPQQ